MLSQEPREDTKFQQERSNKKGLNHWPSIQSGKKILVTMVKCLCTDGIGSPVEMMKSGWVTNIFWRLGL